MSGSVVVLGSANLDQVLRVESLPAPGETVLATGLTQAPGGKGLNQATACARAGAATAFVGAVGADGFGDTLLGWLDDEGVDTAAVRRTAEPTGTALVVVDRAGENSIVVAPGANSTMRELGGEEQRRIRDADTLVMQCEVPVGILLAAAKVGRRVVLNAAPATPLPEELLALVDVLVVNSHEAVALVGGHEPDLAAALATRVRDVVVTLGSQGAVWAGESGSGGCAAPSVVAVDTTGAGDAFVGYLAAALSAGVAWPEAIGRAVRAGSLAVTRPGAAPAIPRLAELAT
jgi:ribokinase